MSFSSEESQCVKRNEALVVKEISSEISRSKFFMTDHNDTSFYARIFFSLTLDSIREKHIYHLCWSLCCSSQ